MKWIEIIIAFIALFVSAYNLYYQYKFYKEEGRDERGQKISWLSGNYSFLTVLILLNVFLLSDHIINYSLDVYKLLVHVVLIVSITVWFVSLKRLKKDY